MVPNRSPRPRWIWLCVALLVVLLLVLVGGTGLAQVRPTPRPTPMPRPMPSPVPQSPYRMPPLSATPDYYIKNLELTPRPEVVAPGPGPDGPAPRFVVIPIPCGFVGADSTSCRVARIVDAVDLANELHTLTRGTDAVDRITDFIERVIDRRPVVVVVPELYVDRVEVMKKIVELEIKSINIVADKVQQDVQRLQPYYWDSDDVRAHKRRVVHETERTVERLREEAARESQSEKTLQKRVTPSGGQRDRKERVLYTPGCTRQELNDSASAGKVVQKRC